LRVVFGEIIDVTKSFIIIQYLWLCFAGCCAAEGLPMSDRPSAAGDPSVARDKVITNASVLSDYEDRVKIIADQTAVQEREERERKRLDAKSVAGQPFKVFKYRKNGTVMFADSVPIKTPYQLIVYNSCYACSVNSNVDWHSTRLHLTEFADAINEQSNFFKVDPALVRAIIHAESAFNPLARSRKGAMGLMQLMPNTASDMGVFNLSDPKQNIRGGVKYLATLLESFKGNEMLATAAYNAGPSAVTRHNGIPPYEETQTYVKRVSILQKRYKTQMVLAKN
jgi:soluble lytic murein transglycosylase-like protein